MVVVLITLIWIYVVFITIILVVKIVASKNFLNNISVHWIHYLIKSKIWFLYIFDFLFEFYLQNHIVFFQGCCFCSKQYSVLFASSFRFSEEMLLSISKSKWNVTQSPVRISCSLFPFFFRSTLFSPFAWFLLIKVFLF